MRKVYLKLELEMIMIVNEGIEISEVVGSLDWQVSDTTGTADIEDVKVQHCEITDSK